MVRIVTVDRIPGPRLPAGTDCESWQVHFHVIYLN
jgi:hypothetical protein